MRMTALLQSTFLRFVLVGGSMAMVYSVLAALATSYLPIPKPVSAGLAWLICIPLAFWGQRRFTFRQSRPHGHAFALYAATQALSIGIVAAVSYLLAQGSFWHDLIVHLGASALAAVASYVINRRIVFPETGPQQK